MPYKVHPRTFSAFTFLSLEGFKILVKRNQVFGLKFEISGKLTTKHSKHINVLGKKHQFNTRTTPFSEPKIPQVHAKNPTVQHTSKFNTFLSSTQKSVGSTHPSVQHTSQFNTPLSSTHFSVQHKKASVQHTSQFHAKTPLFNTSFSSTHPSVQHSPQFNTKKATAKNLRGFWCSTEGFSVLN